MNLRVLALPLSFAVLALAAFMILNYLGTQGGDQGQGSPIQIAGVDDADTNVDTDAPTGILAAGEQEEAAPEESETQEAPPPETPSPESAPAADENDADENDVVENDVAEGQADQPQTDTAQPDNLPDNGQAVPTQATDTIPETDQEITQENQGNQGDEEGGPTDLALPSPGVPTQEAEETPNTSQLESPERSIDESPDQSAEGVDGESEEAQDPEATPLEVTPIEDTPIVEEPLALVALPLDDQPQFGRTTVETNGTVSVLQGRGVPGSVLEILVDDQLLLSTNVNPTGGWSLYAEDMLPTGVNTLTLRARLADGRVGLSDQSLVAFLPDDGGAVKGAVLEGSSVSVLNAPRFVTKLAVEGLIYSPDGLILFGKAPAGAEIVFGGGGPQPSALIGSSGVWSLNLGAMRQGTLIHRSPVTGQQIDNLPLSLPAKPELAPDQAIGMAGGVALGLDGQVLLLF